MTNFRKIHAYIWLSKRRVGLISQCYMSLIIYYVFRAPFATFMQNVPLIATIFKYPSIKRITQGPMNKGLSKQTRD